MRIQFAKRPINAWIATLFLVTLSFLSLGQPVRADLGYPRIEVFSEVDLGRPNSGSDIWTDPSGRIVHGGKIVTSPHILRRTYPISKAQRARLLNLRLNFLGHFGGQKPDITLADYFQASKNDDRQAMFTLMPRSLDFFNQKRLTNQDYGLHSTLVAYQDHHPSSVTVVWLDENTWYVNDVFYTDRGELNSFKETLNGIEENVAEGDFFTFLRCSPLFQSKLSEGFPSLVSREEQAAIPLNSVVLGSTLSAGSPGTSSYHREIAGDGSIMRGPNRTDRKVDLLALSVLLLRANQLHWDTPSPELPKPPVHDQQESYVSFWYNGALLRINESDSRLNVLHRELVADIKAFLSKY